jgi:diguanylate cyclase (GGDEF)-like protein
MQAAGDRTSMAEPRARDEAQSSSPPLLASGPLRRPRTSLATKLVVFVFLTTFSTAVLVSWTSIQATHSHLSRAVDRTYPAALARAAERVEERFGEAEVGAGGAGLSALLSREALPPGGVLLLLDADARVLAVSRPGSEEAALAAAALRGGGPGVRQLRDARGRDWVGSIRPIGGGPLQLALLAPFDVAFEPVIGVVTRLFVVDFSLVLLASFLAFRVTAAVLRPIEVLSDGARSIAQGQIDHEVPEPGTRDEIGVLARTFNDMLRRLRRQQAEIEVRNRDLRERNAELQQAKETFEQLSITDGLTKLHNHRFFQDHLTREILRVGRSGEPLSMLLVDLDDFKQLNDRLGHAAGDELLAGLARILNQSVRATDLLARYGGEEFVVLTPETDLSGAHRLAEKIRTTVAESSFILDDSLRPIRVTVSIGVAQFVGNRKGFFKAADRALYRAKDQGKNCVFVDEESSVV